MDDLIRRSDVLDKVVIYPNYSENGLSVDSYVVFDDDVMSIPAVDAVELRHAYWKNNHQSQTTPLRDGYNCSACGEPATTAYNGAVRSRWCPWCGARMDGRREDGDDA